MITRKERIANAKARLAILDGILNADVNVDGLAQEGRPKAMMHGWTKETAVAWQQKRNIEKYLKHNAW